MKITIEIDVTPAELRQFLGLPDVAGLQEDMIDYVRGRVARGAESFDAADLLRETTDWGNKTLQRLLSLAAGRGEDAPAEPPGDKSKPGAARAGKRRAGGTPSED